MICDRSSADRDPGASALSGKRAENEWSRQATMEKCVQRPDRWDLAGILSATKCKVLKECENGYTMGWKGRDKQIT